MAQRSQQGAAARPPLRRMLGARVLSRLRRRGAAAGARLLRRQRAAAHAPRPQSKHSLLTSFTTILAGSRAGARCDAARGCCGSGGRRRTRRGPKVSTVHLLPLLLLSLAPELARAATRRKAAAAAEGGGPKVSMLYLLSLLLLSLAPLARGDAARREAAAAAEGGVHRPPRRTATPL